MDLCLRCYSGLADCAFPRSLLDLLPSDVYKPSHKSRRSAVLRLRFGVLCKSPPANACDDVKKRMQGKEFCSRMPTFGNRLSVEILQQHNGAFLFFELMVENELAIG
jgi:hypothetical protein